MASAKSEPCPGSSAFSSPCTVRKDDGSQVVSSSSRPHLGHGDLHLESSVRPALPDFQTLVVVTNAANVAGKSGSCSNVVVMPVMMFYLLFSLNM